MRTKILPAILFAAVLLASPIPSSFTCTSSLALAASPQSIAASTTRSEANSIVYSTIGTNPVAFRDHNFNVRCENKTGSNLDYVTFTIPPSYQGTLYYQYQDANNRGSQVSSSTKYYRSESPHISDITFAAASGFTGVVEIPYSGYSIDQHRFSGTVSIDVRSPQDAGLISYTSDGSPVRFQISDFSRACDVREEGSFSSASFSLPDPSCGTLYYRYRDPSDYDSLVDPSVSYQRTGTPDLSRVTFLPRAGYSGDVTISYSGEDDIGNLYSASIQIVVSPAQVSRYFSDMDGYEWGAAAVDFLHQANIVNGVSLGRFGPEQSMTRGDFMLMLYRAFHLPRPAANAPSFSDVPANSYYAEAISAAESLGIAQGSDGCFYPKAAITREDAVVLIQRTAQAAGWDLAEADPALLTACPDSGEVSEYAMDAMASLYQLGAVQGGSDGRLNPKRSMTRVEMAVILHRVLTSHT